MTAPLEPSPLSAPQDIAPALDPSPPLPCPPTHNHTYTPPTPQGPYINEPGTPVTEMWEALHGTENKKEHMVRSFGG